MGPFKIVAIFVSLNLISLTQCDEKSCQEEFVCGKRPIDHHEKYNKSYEGDAYPGQWPWVGIIYHRKPDQIVEFACSGVLISEKHVLASILCATSENGTVLNSEDVLFRIGTHRKNYFNFGNARHRSVSKIHQPKDFDEKSKNELVILELSHKVKFNDYVQPGCIKLIGTYYGERVTAVGWGLRDRRDSLSNRNIRCPHGIQVENTAVCDKDRGAVILIFNEFEPPLPFIFGIINCIKPTSCQMYADIEDSIVFVHSYQSWIANTANLDYLRMVRKGQHFDPAKQYPNLLPRRNCGNIQIGTNETKSTAQLYEFPWMALIFTRHEDNGDLYAFCHGTIVSHRYVLTAAYCADHAEPTFVRLGDFDIYNNPDCSEDDPTDCAPPFEDYDVEYLLQHPDVKYKDLDSEFRRFYYSVFVNDIALIRTKKIIVYKDHIQPICLPVNQELSNQKNPQYVITGWKFKYLLLRGVFLQKEIEDNILNITECSRDRPFHEKTNFNAVICSNKFDLYHPGLPLANVVNFKGTNRYVQYGLRSISRTGSIYYTLISHYMDWIIANMEE